MQTTSAAVHSSTRSTISPANAVTGMARGTAAAGLQDLREHHGGDFIRLAPSGQAENRKTRRVDLVYAKGIFVCHWRVRGLPLGQQFLLTLALVLNHLLQAFRDEVVTSVLSRVKRHSLPRLQLPPQHEADA